MIKKVFLGIGHGGSDPGAVANGFEEADLNLTIGMACKAELERHGVLVKVSRTKDENDPLTEEIKECNAYDPDVAVDIHNNAGGGDGGEVFYHIGGGVSKILAKDILAEIVAIGQNSRGIKTKTNSAGKDYFGFIRETKAPAVIVECAFVDNKTDMKILDTAAEQKAMGVAIAKGILKTLGVTYQPVKAPAAKPATDYANHWAKAAIQNVIDKGLMVGDGKGNFRPSDPVTRGELAQVITTLLKYLGK